MSKSSKNKPWLSVFQQRNIFTALAIFLTILVLLTPFFDVADPVSHVGGLLVWAAILEIFHGFRRADNYSRQTAWFSGTITLLIGTLMINALLFQKEALIQLVLILFLIDAARYLYYFVKYKQKGIFTLNNLLSGLGNLIAIALILIFRGQSVEWVISLCGALRIFGTIYNIFTAKTGTVKNVAEDVVESMGLESDPELEALAKKLRKRIDRKSPDRCRLDHYLPLYLVLYSPGSHGS